MYKEEVHVFWRNFTSSRDVEEMPAITDTNNRAVLSSVGVIALSASFKYCGLTARNIVLQFFTMSSVRKNKFRIIRYLKTHLINAEPVPL